MIYKKGKLFGIFNIIDVAILLVLVAAIFGFVLKSGILNRVSLATNDRDITVTFLLEKISTDNAGGYREGDSLIDNETGAVLGTIISVEETPSQELIRKQDGTITQARLPNYWDVTVVVEGEGTQAELGNFINGTRHVAPGGKVRVNTLYSSGTALVLSVDSVKK